MSTTPIEQQTGSDEVVQLVVASLFGEHYGIPIVQVQEIIKPTEITPIPNMPAYLEGVINLRGKIVPVVDLYSHFKLGQKVVTEETRIVVSSVGEQPVGLMVDAVIEVIRMPLNMIEPIPKSICTIDADFVRGVGKVHDRLVIVLNLDLIIADLERKARA